MRIKTSSKAKFDQIIEQEDALYLFNATADIHTNILIGYKFLCDKNWLKYTTLFEASK